MNSIVTQEVGRRNDATIVLAVPRNELMPRRKADLMRQCQMRRLSGRLTSRESAAPICREARPLAVLAFF